ncbi:hypothetical protein AVEN_100842-1 [Araneus ventricosus]|uniref:Uncharacterized protein n=1 Tax=Araneus ventricosus TaxID=182803 RepID=A0A4Y2AY05_ARAVE|nr:hypothetical protein AVEN_100842-1 [Araneus ventricosus]
MIAQLLCLGLSSTNPLSSPNAARILDQIVKARKNRTTHTANNMLIFIPNRTGGCFLDGALRLAHLVYDIISTKEIRFWVLWTGNIVSS